MTIATFLVSSSEWHNLIGGLVISLKVTGLSLLFGLPGAVAVALLVDSRHKVIRSATLLFVEFGRGLPVLVLLYLIYYGLPSQGVVLPPTTCAVVALSISCAAYVSETIRASLHAVPEGQRQAGRSLGLPEQVIFTRIVLPQAGRIALPQILSWAILYLQASSLAYVVTVEELTSRASRAGSESFDYMNLFLATAFLYAIVCLPAAKFATYLERRLSSRL